MRGKIIDAGHTTYYVLNSRVTEQNLTTVLGNVQKWLPINRLTSKLRYSNPFRNACVPNEGRSSNCDQVIGPVDPEIIDLRAILKKKEKMRGKA